MVDETNEDNSWYRLTPKGKEIAFKLLQGETPSSLGESFISAAVMLYGLECCIREALSKIDEAPINREEAFSQLNALLEEIKTLKKLYKEASFLSQEL